MSKRPLGIDVLTAARDRIARAFDAAERVYVSFSGGKDSTVMLHMVMDEAIRRKRRVGLLFVDLEAQYVRTIEHVAACYARYAEHVDPYWVALPLNLRNAVSQYQPQWMCWDPEREADWVRRAPESAITDPASLPFFRLRMEFEDFVPRFADWYSQGKSTACFVGIRTQESLNRWRSIASQSKARIDGWCWSTRVSGTTAWNAYPLYDWRTEDIWTYHANYPDAPSNSIYDLMHRAGLTIHQARICQPYGDDQRRGLWLFHLLEPETWARVVARVNGANQGALYAQERGSILGVNKIAKPEGHTWQSFAEMLLASMPEPTAEHYRTKIGVFTQWWDARGYENGIPDEEEPKAEASRSAPSWRRICKALLRNDYWCKGLSFSQHKDTASYARYQAIMSSRRKGVGLKTKAELWKERCGPEYADRPTSKQLAVLAALTGGCSPYQAYQALARHLGCSTRKATNNATRSDAARAIEQLHKANADFGAEKFANSPRRGGRKTGLAGESKR